MKRLNRISILLMLCALFTGCANVSSKQQVLAAGSQVEVRSYQTRTYDTNDRIRVIRTVMATLQDLRFVIDKADDVIGVVSATKLDGYALSISVSVRPNGEQMIVRANAQLNLKAIEEPGPYQDFFAALDKGLFLDNNMLVETQVAATPQTLTPTNTIQAEAPATSVYSFYGEAEAEVNEASQDLDLWARALVEVEGDEQKRKARYIELRAAELQAQDSGTPTRQASSTSSPASRTSNTGLQSASPELALKASSTVAGLPADYLTGNYIDNNGNAVMIEQTGNTIKGSYGQLGGTIDGTLTGDTIEYKWEQQLESNRRWVSGLGRFQVSAGGRVLSGNWWDPSSSTRQGTWTLTKVGTLDASNREQNLGAAMSSALMDLTQSETGLSGTYVSEITTDTHWVFQNPKHRRLLVTVDQRGGEFTATADAANLKISGSVNGDSISFYTWPSDISFGEIKGKWKILDGGARLEGKWTHPHGTGKWNLTRLQ